MDKLKMHSMNKVDENIEKIGKLFPNCITERKNEKGEVEYAIDFDMLKQELSSVVVEGNDERYQFTWPDKKKSILLANAPIAKTLRPCREESVDFDNTENLYIEGDNLDVLKLLQETYLGKVKLIYIDPPYNTGHDFVYNDTFKQDVNDYLDNSGQIDEFGNQLLQNTESNGRYHTDWLNMFYPRLKVAKDLLTNDGVVFISIDVNEQQNLRKICDEIFGEKCFITDFIWNSRKSVSNDAIVSLNHNYTLVYTKNISDFIANKSKFKFADDGSGFDNPDNDPRGAWKADPFDSPGIRPNLTYAITNPNTGEEYWPPEGRCWRTGEKEYLEFLKDGRIVFGKNGTSKPQLKRFYSEAQSKGLTPKSLWDDCGTATDGTKEILDIFNTKIFDTPKPTSFIKKIIDLAGKDEALILDFFSGSATTAHAVMQLNAEDGGNRKFIMVQLPEETDEKSEAYKAGYKNICEIGKERIRRAGAKIKEDLRDRVVTKNGVTAVRRPKPENSIYEDNSVDIIENPILVKTVDEWKTPRPEKEYNELIRNLDTGFRVLKLDSTNMKDVYYNPADYELSLFDNLADNIKEDRTPEDLLFQVMLDLGVLLSSKIEESIIGGKKVFDVADGFLYACFDENVTEDVITEIAKKNPYYFVMRDSSMANDSVATNFEQIFATYSPDTVRKVL